MVYFNTSYCSKIVIMQTKFRFGTVAIAGTFDRLHKGHHYFIKKAFSYGEKVIIGLTSDEFVKAKFQSRHGGTKIPASPAGRQITNYQKRKKELENFLREEKLLDRAAIVRIDDVYGSAIEKNDIQALVVTKETLSGARLVNRKRKSKHLSLLKIHIVPLILAQDRKRIASTRIRLGEIDRWGRILKSQISNFKSQIKEELRQELKKPQGILIKGDQKNHQRLLPELKKAIGKLHPIMISTIGDEVTKLCNQIDLEPNLAVIDYKVNRKRKYYSLSDLGFPKTYVRGVLANVVTIVRNPPGNITKTLVKAVSQTIKKYIQNDQNQIIRVLGEEDLAGVPAILLSPLGSIVLYGQPGEGVVVVEVTEEKKKELTELFKKYP